MPEPMNDQGERFDVRVAVGTFFATIGALLAFFGGLSAHPPTGRSLGINVDLWWGLVLWVFGTLLLWLAWMARHHMRSRPRHPPI